MNISPPLRAVFAASGLTIGAAALIGLTLPSVGKMLFIQAESPGENELVHAETRQVATAGPMMARRAKLTVRYPKVMKENETSVVEVFYHVESVDIGPRPDAATTSDFDPRVQEMETLDADLSINLGSSGFKLDPKENVRLSAGTRLPVVQKWTITPEGEGRRVLVLRIEERDIAGTRVLLKLSNPVILDASTTINGESSDAFRNGYVELPVEVTNYFGVSRKAASIVAVAASAIGFILGWPIFTGAVGKRRSVRCTVHNGFFPEDHKEFVFVKVVNLSPERAVEITHVWFATTPRVDVINPARPLPRRLDPDQTWETWISYHEIPRAARSTIFDKGVVQLSSGRQICSCRAKNVPPIGHVAGT